MIYFFWQIQLFPQAFKDIPQSSRNLVWWLGLYQNLVTWNKIRNKIKILTFSVSFQPDINCKLTSEFVVYLWGVDDDVSVPVLSCSLCFSISVIPGEACMSHPDAPLPQVVHARLPYSAVFPKPTYLKRPKHQSIINGAPPHSTASVESTEEYRDYGCGFSSDDDVSVSHPWFSSKRDCWCAAGLTGLWGGEWANRQRPFSFHVDIDGLREKNLTVWNPGQPVSVLRTAWILHLLVTPAY